MKKSRIFAAALGLFLVTAFQRDNIWVDSRNVFDMQQITTFDFSKLKQGDIIFQSSQSEQCLAVQLATQSVYSHCGIIYLKNGEYHIYEAVQPFKYTPLKNWIAKGLHGQFAIKRLKDAESVLTAKTLRKMKNIGNLFLNRDYDITFEWSDDKIYCSELVWKIYQRATGLRVGELQSLRDLDLSSEIVKKIMKERYGNNIPLDEIVISPVAIFESDLLELVYSNY